MILEAIIFQAATVTLPVGWLRHCATTQDPGCVVRTITPEDLAYINVVVTEAIKTSENPDPNDPWEVFPAHGDCDDQAITERAILRSMGVPSSDMRLVAGRVAEPDGRKLNHLTLEVTINGKIWVLDRKTPETVYAPARRPYAWEPLPSQTADRVLWGS